MKLKDTVILAFLALKYRRLRSSLTILGVVIGTSLIIILTSQTAGLNEYFVSKISRTGLNSIFVIPVGRFRISIYDLATFNNIPGVKRVIPIIRGTAVIAIANETVNVQVIGIDSDSLSELFPGLKLLEGTLPGKYDYVSLVAGYNVAFPVSNGEDETQQLIVGQPLGIAFRRYRQSSYIASMIVSGILESYGAITPFPVDDVVLISLEAANAVFNKRNYYDAVILIAEDVSLVDQVMEELKNTYGRRIRSIAPSQIVETITSISNQISLFLGLIAAVSLIVASIGTANIMYISVIERTKLIGLLKALGATESTILLLFLMESALVGLIGGVIGVIAGIALSHIIGPIILRSIGLPIMRAPRGRTAIIEVKPVFTVELIFIAFLAALLSGVIAGIIPARRAAKLDPVKVLRQE